MLLIFFDNAQGSTVSLVRFLGSFKCPQMLQTSVLLITKFMPTDFFLVKHVYKSVFLGFLIVKFDKITFLYKITRLSIWFQHVANSYIDGCSNFLTFIFGL
jgi:hypothetical protein